MSQTGSTNADLSQTAETEPTVARVLFADEQTEGRGRLGRSWEMASGGGLMVSFFVPWIDPASTHLVPVALGVAIARSIVETGVSAGLKWPNDVVVGERASDDLVGKKLGGMLSSSVRVDGALAGVVAGLGCNISWPPPDYPQLPEATALNQLGDGPVDAVSLGRELIRRFDIELSALEEQGPEQLLARYREYCVTLGQDVRVEVGGERLEGRATDIDLNGALLIEVDGRQRAISVGDVVHLR